MPITRRLLLGASSAAALVPYHRVRAQAADKTIRLGMLTDMSGPYRDVTGPTGVACARQAIAEFTAAHPDTKVELVVADHQNKPDIAVGTVREWFDRGGVDAIVGVDSSAVALACTTVALRCSCLRRARASRSCRVRSSTCSRFSSVRDLPARLTGRWR